MATKKVHINRAPVLTLWAVIVAERLGHKRATALTLGRALAGLNAQTKGRRLGIFEDAEKTQASGESSEGPKIHRVDLMGRAIPAVRTRQGLRAATRGKAIEAESVERYLSTKFGDDLDDVRREMVALARAFPRTRLAEEAYSLYEKFRPSIPRGEKGWGKKGELDLGVIRKLRP